MAAQWILEKRYIRSDALWTTGLLFRSFLARIPIALDVWALSRSASWSRTRLEELQDRRLSRLGEAAARIPFWQHMMSSHHVLPARLSREKLERLPVISKKTFRALPRHTYTDTRLVGSSVNDRTSGSTGMPFSFFFDRNAELRSFAITERMLRNGAGGRRAHVVYMRSRYRQGFTFIRHIWFYLRGYNSIRYRADDLITTCNRAGRPILYGYTSSVLEAVRQFEMKGQIPLLTAVMSTGEAIRDSERAYIQKVTGAPFFLVYASREAGWIGNECAEGTMHLNEEWAYVEVVDEKGVRVPDGNSGRIVVTTFDNHVMPLIRYDIGDRGYLKGDSCLCGRESRSIHISGRQSELIRIGNRTVSLLDISAAIDSFHRAVTQFQVEQTESLSLLVRVVPGTSFDSAREELTKLLIRVTHPNITLQWEIVSDIPPAESGKAKYFIQSL